MNRHWTFLNSGITISAFAVTVQGHFVFFDYGLDEAADPRGQTPRIAVHYLTPPENPVSFDLPKWMFKENADSLEEVSSKDVENVIGEIFSHGYSYIPKAPSEIDIHKVPPSFRDSLLEAEDVMKKKKTFN